MVAKGYKKGERNAVAEDTVYASTYDCENEDISLQMYNTIGNLEADGSDAAWILAELKDKNGQREFYGDEVVQAKIVSGPGKLIYAGENPVMVDGISGFYLQSEKDQAGTTKIQTEVDLGVNMDDNATEILYLGTGWKKLKNQQDAYQGTLHESAVSGDSVTIKFTGTQIDVYSESSDKNGEAVVTLDGKEAGKLSCKNIAKYNTIANQRVYRSGQLEDGEHTLTITVTEGKVNLDRVKVFDGTMDVSGVLEVETELSDAARVQSRPDFPDAEIPLTNGAETLELLLQEAKNINETCYTVSSALTLKDAITFSECVLETEEPSEEILYKAIKLLQSAIENLETQPVSTITHEMKVMEGQSGGVAYVSQTDNVWITGDDSTYANKSRTEKDYYTISFTGVMIELFSMLDSAHGIAAISVDGGEEVEVNQYRAEQEKDVLFWKSDLLEYGTHTVKVRVTGKNGGNPDNACVSFGKANIYEKIDELEEAKRALTSKIKESEQIERVKYTKESLEALDNALFYAEKILQEKDISIERVDEAMTNLSEAIRDLQVSGTENNVITCLDEDAASSEGELNKIYYSSEKEEDWVLENADKQELRNKYLKKAATGQERAYASIKFEGTQVELFSRFSNTSGLLEIELYDEGGNEIDSRTVDLYDASVGAGSAGTRQVYQSELLEKGIYTLKILPKNEASPNNSNKELTSINLAKVVVANAEDKTIDMTQLESTLTRLNKMSMDKKHPHTIQSFYVNVQYLLKKSYGILSGDWPNIQLVKDLPDGLTDARVNKVTVMINDILDKLNMSLTVQEVGTLKEITVSHGTEEVKIPFPEQVVIVSSEGQREKVKIVGWTCEGYSGAVPGKYMFEGTLEMPEGMENPQEKKAYVQVIVEKAEEPDDQNPDIPDKDDQNPDIPTPDDSIQDSPITDSPSEETQNQKVPEQEASEKVPTTGDEAGTAAIGSCIASILLLFVACERKKREKERA